MSFWKFFGRTSRKEDASPEASSGGPADTLDADRMLVEAVDLALDGEDPAEKDALRAIEAAASAGSADAEFLCGILHLYGQGLAKGEPERAEMHFRRAADRGSLDALYEWGVGLEARSAPKQELIGIYLRGAQRGHLPCINGLRAQYRGSPAHLSEFASWTAKAAALGDAEAQYSLGLMYATGDGVEQSLRNAVEWYRRAADQSFPEACHNLGVYYATGQGVEKDLAIAADWYRRACELGSRKSCKTLASMYYHGEGVSKDRERAEAWMAKADAFAEAERLKPPTNKLDLSSLGSQRIVIAREWLGRIRDRHVARKIESVKSELSGASGKNASGENDETLIPETSDGPRDIPRLTGTMKAGFLLSMKTKETPTDWEGEQGGIVRGSKHVPAPGLGMFGLISLNATLTPTNTGYECEITAGCIPFSQQGKETARTLDEAKLKTERVWASQAGIMALILLKSNAGA